MSLSAPRRASLSELGFARPAAVIGILIVALALQTTVLTKMTLLGVIPQLLFVAVVSLAFLEGPGVGVVVGFAAGLLLDFLLPLSIVGLTALVYTLVGFGVGSFRQYAPNNTVWMPVLAVAISSMVAEGSYAVLSIMMGARWVSFSDTAQIGGLVVLYNTLLTPFVFPVVRRVADRVRPERVVRL